MTGYSTDWRGEVRVNAWELGAGLGTHLWGAVIMLSGFFLGVVFAPLDTLRAFVRGRRSTNLYSEPLPPEALDQPVEALSQAYHGCTKIRSQPLPFSYSQLIALLTFVYCSTVPACFINSFGQFIFLPTFVMALVYFGISHVGSELSDPFGSDHTDLKLDVFLAQVEENLGDYIHRWTRLTKAEALSASGRMNEAHTTCEAQVGGG